MFKLWNNKYVPKLCGDHIRLQGNTLTHNNTHIWWYGLGIKAKEETQSRRKTNFLKTVAMSRLHFDGCRPHLFYIFVSVWLVCVYLRRSESETNSQHLLVIHLSGHIVRSVGKWFWCKHIKTWVLQALIWSFCHLNITGLRVEPCGTPGSFH